MSITKNEYLIQKEMVNRYAVQIEMFGLHIIFTGSNCIRFIDK